MQRSTLFCPVISVGSSKLSPAIFSKIGEQDVHKLGFKDILGLETLLILRAVIFRLIVTKGTFPEVEVIALARVQQGVNDVLPSTFR